MTTDIIPIRITTADEIARFGDEPGVLVFSTFHEDCGVDDVYSPGIVGDLAAAFAAVPSEFRADAELRFHWRTHESDYSSVDEMTGWSVVFWRPETAEEVASRLAVRAAEKERKRLNAVAAAETRKLAAERHDREEYERLRAKFGDGK